MARRIVGIALILLALCLAILTPFIAFPALATRVGTSLGVVAPTPVPYPSPAPFVPQPIPSLTPALTVQGMPPSITARSAYLLDSDTGQVLLDTNGEQPLPMASTTKIMTALIAIQTANLDMLVPVHQDALNEVTNNGGSSALLVLNDRIPLKELLYGLLLPSGDDAAVAIADAVAGSTSAFVQRMNLFARRLHLFQTHYANPDGLPATGHYTTAADLARLTSYAMTLPLFDQIVSQTQYKLAPTNLHHGYTWATTNPLLPGQPNVYAGTTGVKTGTTPEAGYCLVFTATRNNRHLTGVVLHSSGETTRATDAIALLNWGFHLPTTSST
jgi:D-alanyl-D-alanine carboxypeptidase (penicillin-binding protein 5/6)